MWSLRRVVDQRLRAFGRLVERRSLKEAIEEKSKRNDIAIIAELKRRSPSSGELRRIEDPASLAKSLEAAGAAAISVLTAEEFGGCLEDLKAVKRAVSIPVLRKDFIVHELQLYESLAAGADAVLMIARLLKEKTPSFVEKASQLGLEALVEVSSAEELEKYALPSSAKLIGINNRDPETLKVNLARTEELLPLVPQGRIVVSESGIENKEHLRRVLRAGAKAALIGTALMKAPSPAERLREFLSS